MGPDIPDTAVGDDKRLLQTALNVVGNAVKFTKEGHVNVIVGMERPEYPRDPRQPDFRPTTGEHHFFLRVQVLRLPGLVCTSPYGNNRQIGEFVSHMPRKF